MMPPDEGPMARAVARLPAHMRAEAEAYVARGQRPSGFLFAVLSDSLAAATSYADRENAAALALWGAWLFAIPRGAWGSAEAVDAWVTTGGLAGLLDAPPE